MLLVNKNKILIYNNKKYKFIPIKKNMAWSDEPNDIEYNKLIETKNYHKEALYRDDNIYNLILIINYNTNPVIPNKGSAIFLHVSTKDYKPTNGCIAIDVNDFIEILALLDTNEKINIS